MGIAEENMALQSQLLEERDILDAKLKKLRAFITKAERGEVACEHKHWDILLQQKVIMEKYIGILGERINLLQYNASTK